MSNTSVCPTRARPLAILAAGMLLASLGGSLTGCVPLVVGGAAATGGVVATKQQTVGGQVDDVLIGTQLRGKLARSSYDDLYRNVAVEVERGRILMTGRVPTPEARVRAEEAAWQVNGVREVINELQVADRTTLRDDARDTWITTQIRTRLIATRGIRSNNYNIETVNGTVYLLGVAPTETERRQVVEVARRTQYVNSVVNHIVLASERR